MPVLHRYQNPAYTGSNRCVPCTITNVAIAALGSLALAALAPPLGVAAFAVAILTIYLRGYLVPGTPTFTRRYFPDWLLAVFDKADPTPASADVEATLVAAGVLHDEAVDLVLDPRFAAAWDERMADVDAERDGLSDAAANRLDAVELAALTDLDPDGLDVQRYGEAVVATLDAERIGRWESRAAFVADVAAAHELDDWVPRWRSIPVAGRSELLGGLRLFLERCPACGAVLTLDHEVVRSCCRERDVIAMSCSGCGSRLLEADFDVSALDADADADAGMTASPVETH
ncbi:hypothetical protein [Haloplanus salinus]|jgi:hypothetical protein|uniref:hypothetical protein n=1 Tax=Haloplanus salinus TaxID=1126245 RepID=UPI0015F1216C|nr:hypothetical protein [Haloplanus salinus]